MVTISDNKESNELFNSCLDKTIIAIQVYCDDLVLKFDDNTGIKISDDGQSCCESRYMNTDDDLTNFVGAKLLGAELNLVDECQTDDKYREYKEIQFLIIKTSKGDFTVANYNEHNGYYGGFYLKVKKLQ